MLLARNDADAVLALPDSSGTDRADLAQAQDEITGRLARTLNVELVEASVRRIEQERAVDPDARDLVTRGWALSNRMASAETQTDAQRAFERALEIDPESVDARIGLAEVLVSAYEGSSSFDQNVTRAERLIFEALERDPRRSRAQFAMGLIRRRQGRLSDSKIEFEAAIALDSNQTSGHRQLGITLMFLGQPEGAITQLDKSTRLSPHDPFIALNYHALGTCHHLLGQVDEAIDLLRKARATSPRYRFVHINLAAALGLKGDLDEARAALAEGVKLRPELNSLARLRATVVSNNVEYLRLREKTIEVGLRKAGMPEESLPPVFAWDGLLTETRCPTAPASLSWHQPHLSDQAGEGREVSGLEIIAKLVPVPKVALAGRRLGHLATDQVRGFRRTRGAGMCV